jgi:hypothetical protein
MAKPAQGGRRHAKRSRTLFMVTCKRVNAAPSRCLFSLFAGCHWSRRAGTRQCLRPPSSPLDIQPSTFDLRPSTFDLRPSTFAPRHPTFAQRLPPNSQKKDAKRTQFSALALSKTPIRLQKRTQTKPFRQLEIPAHPSPEKTFDSYRVGAGPTDSPAALRSVTDCRGSRYRRCATYNPGDVPLIAVGRVQGPLQEHSP